MPLPKIAVPKYSIVIPSTKRKTSFRPFLMKEQKVLFMALESNDTEQMFSSICDIIKTCVDGIDNPMSMPMFDLEYLFLKIRSKSVGEVVDITVKCPTCSKIHPKQINLDEVEITFPPDLTNKIMINDTMGIVLKYPCLHDAIKDFTKMDADGIVKFVCDSIEVVFDENTTYTRKDFTEEELVNFVESMNTVQFDKIGSFYKNLPHLEKTIDCQCSGCSADFKVDFRSLSDFFT